MVNSQKLQHDPNIHIKVHQYTYVPSTLVVAPCRLKMYGFWNEESRLASDTLGRLTQLLAVLYSTSTEHQFLFHSTNLMLELTSRSPDYNRTMFDSPLSECKFEVG